MKEFLKDTKLVVLDLDGTLWNGETVIEGAIELVKYLQQNYKVIFFSNSSSDTSKYIFIKLLKLGFEAYEEDIYNVFDLITNYLKEKNINNVYAIGSNSVMYNLASNHINVINTSSADHVLVCMDKNFNYDKINDALAIINKGGKFIACNIDSNYPIENNKLLAGCGTMIGAIRGATGKKPDYIIGKPNTYFLDFISKKYDITNNEILVIGDRFESDVQMALNYNCKYIMINKYDKFIYHFNTGISIPNLTQTLNFIKET